MGQVHIDHVTLDELVQASSLIVVALPAESVEVREPITDPTWDGEEAPPFVWHKRVFEIEDVLLGGPREGTVEVMPADLEWDRSLHRRYYVDGVSTSPMKQRYPGPRLADAARILFLTAEQGRFQFVVEGAEESLEQLEDVRACIARRSPDVVAVDDEPRTLPKWWRIALLVMIVAAVWCIGWATGLHELVTVEEIRQGVADAGAWGFAAFIVLFCIGQVAQIGGHPFIAAAVLLWGWWVGGLVSIVAGSLGAIINFAFCRAVGGDAHIIDNRVLARVLSYLDRAPIRTMFVARVLFMTAPLLAGALALSGVRHRDHAIATILGLIPSVLVASYAWSVGLSWFL